MKPLPGRALAAALAGLAFGLGALGLGAAKDSLALGGLGCLTLLQVPLAFVVRQRLRGGLGNQGLDQERRALRAVGHLLTLAALGLLALGLAELAGSRGPDPAPGPVVLSLAILFGGLAHGRSWGRGELPPTLALDRSRSWSLAGMAGLAALGGGLGFWFPWADAATALALAAAAFLEGRRLRGAVAVKAACGGCGGCACG